MLVSRRHRLHFCLFRRSFQLQLYPHDGQVNGIQFGGKVEYYPSNHTSHIDKKLFCEYLAYLGGPHE